MPNLPSSHSFRALTEQGVFTMTAFIRTLAFAILVIASACSSDAAKRTAYETLQNVGQQECVKNKSSDCGNRESYDDYQRRRKELGPPAN
jgi:hypothetical protein